MNSFSMMMIALALTAAGCAGTPVRGDEEPVPTGEWCESMGDAMCGQLAAQCFKGMSGVASSCAKEAKRSCLRSRSAAAPSGRLGRDQRTCREAISSLSCRELGAAMGQMASQQGPLARCTLDR